MAKIIDLQKERQKRNNPPEVERLRLAYEKSFLERELKLDTKSIANKYKELKEINEKLRQVSNVIHNCKLGHE